MLKNILKVLLSGLLLTSVVFAAEQNVIVPIDAKLEYNHGLDLYKLGKYEDAIASFRTAIRLYPDYIDAYYNLGSILDYLNQHDEAIYVLKQIVARQQDDYEAIYKIAEIAAKSGDRITASQYVALIPASTEYYIKAKELQQKFGIIKGATNSGNVLKGAEKSTSYLNIDSPTGIATDSEGNVYVASFSNNSIIKITPDNKRIIFFKNPILKGPISIAIDSQNNLYIANYNANNIIKVSRLGNYEIFISNIQKPYAIYISGNMLFVSSQGDNAVLRKRIF